MRLYSAFFLFILFLSSVLLTSFKIQDSETWLIHSNSTLTVDGKTNINSFDCVVSPYGKSDTLTYVEDNLDGHLYSVYGSLYVPINRFDCHHRVMTRDLQKTLKANEYPYMKISFISFSDKPSSFGKAPLTGHAEIVLAGAKMTYKIDFVLVQRTGGLLEVEGIKKIHFSDFNLRAPTKLGGAIRVNDELKVTINLKMKQLS